MSAAAPPGRLGENVMHFARVLRAAGLPVGPRAVLDALDALQTGVMVRRDDFYWTLHCLFVRSHEHSVLFDQAFHAFWRKPKLLEQMMQTFFQQVAVGVPDRPRQAGQTRIADALFADTKGKQEREAPMSAVELDSMLTASSREVLRRKDFDQMTAEEQLAAHAAIAHMRLHRIQVPTRRFRPAPRGKVIDMRRTLKRSLASGGGLIDLQRRNVRRREPPLVVLADISGSMSNYSRMFMHFVHALTNSRDRVWVFLFATRLTNITRELARRDVDEAMASVTAAAGDWSAGTRIGVCLKAFNDLWSRRVLGRGAHVLIMTDGLERDDPDMLAAEMARLKRSAKRVVWLNPLLRYHVFEATACGIAAMMAHVDEFRPVHSLDSLDDLARALCYSDDPAHNPRRWIERARTAA